METYSFEIVIGFRVEADNKHDALAAALDTQNSLNDGKHPAQQWRQTEVVRSIAPSLQHFNPFEGSDPRVPCRA